MKTIYLFIFLGLAIGCVSKTLSSRTPQSTTLSQSDVFFEQLPTNSGKDFIKAGYLLESANAEFKGCVMYLEGLGDSVNNHYPFFNKLRQAGYRILLFDYLGQGGSSGDMNSTRVSDNGSPYEIGTQAKAIWKRYSEQNDFLFGRNCSQSKKMVIGWSTGGLVTYKLAHEKWADGYVLIAPGIAIETCVGEAGDSCPMGFANHKKVITLRTLTTNTYPNGNDPHFDPPRPDSPLKAPLFALNLTLTSWESQNWTIDQNQKGIVFLSGKNDTYVDRDKTLNLLKTNAPSFSVVVLEGALHEIDNEIPAIADVLHSKTIQFLDGLVGRTNANAPSTN